MEGRVTTRALGGDMLDILNSVLTLTFKLPAHQSRRCDGNAVSPVDEASCGRQRVSRRLPDDCHTSSVAGRRCSHPQARQSHHSSSGDNAHANTEV